MLTRSATWLILILALLSGTGPSLLAQAKTNAPPAANRPADFSQIVGIDYRISYTAEPTEVVVEDPVTIKIRITGKDPPGKDAKKYQPQRRFLQLFSEDDRHNFYIEPVAGQDRFVPGKNGQNTWEFVYRVRPKSMRVKQVPAPNLAYYWPGRGYVRVPADQERIPLTVTPRGVTDSDVLGLKDIKVPERLYQLATGDALLAREDPWPYWNPPLLIALGFGIPIASWLGVSFWQWMFPDSLRRLQRRRSLAARRAVRELGQSKNACSASSLAGILARYLRQRLDFPAVEPTPAEVARFLRRRGVLAAAAQQWADLFRSLDEARYTPANVVDSMPPPEGDLWTTHAANLIHALEADPCLARMR